MLSRLEVAENLLPPIKAVFEEFSDAENYLRVPLRNPSGGHVHLLRGRWEGCRTSSAASDSLTTTPDRTMVRVWAQMTELDGDVFARASRPEEPKRIPLWKLEEMAGGPTRPDGWRGNASPLLSGWDASQIRPSTPGRAEPRGRCGSSAPSADC